MGIRGVSKIVVAVEDQGRAKKFWAEVIGFEVTLDVPYDDKGNNWVEVTSADGETVLILSEEPQDRSAPDELPTSKVFFYADDIVKTYEELSAKGVLFPAPPEEQPWGWWAMFVDSEGNRFALQQC